MTRMRTMTIAMTSRMWMKPPIVYDVTMPRSHRTRRMTKMVQSMFLPPSSWIEQLPCRAWNGSSSSAASAGVERNAAPRDVLCKSDKKAGESGTDRPVDEFQVFGKEDWFLHAGNWRVNEVPHPDGKGLRPISDAAHAHGMKFLLWFEPERA